MTTSGARSGARTDKAIAAATVATVATVTVATVTVATVARPRRTRRARHTAQQAMVAAPAAAPAAATSDEGIREANRRIQAIADPPGECPWCMSELGLPGTAGTTTRLCRWHEFTTWIALATRYPALWPKVRAEFGQAVLIRLVTPAAALADGAAGSAGAGALVVDIAVR